MPRAASTKWKDNPELAYQLAKKAVGYESNKVTGFNLAVEAHNFAGSILKMTNFHSILDLQREAIAFYESDPKDVESFMPTNTAAQWYFRGAVAAANLGILKEAERYAYKAATLDPSEARVNLLVQVLYHEGYQVHSFGFRINPPLVKIYLNTTNGWSEWDSTENAR